MTKAHPNRVLILGVMGLSFTFILAKLFFFALPSAEALGKIGRGIFRELVISMNLFLGYQLIPTPAYKKQFLRCGILLELCFLAFVSIYAYVPNYPPVVAQLQIMFRELLLSPLYFVLFYFTVIHRKTP